jgi:hypothetical protein
VFILLGSLASIFWYTGRLRHGEYASKTLIRIKVFAVIVVFTVYSIILVDECVFDFLSLNDKWPLDRTLILILTYTYMIDAWSWRGKPVGGIYK